MLIQPSQATLHMRCTGSSVTTPALSFIRSFPTLKILVWLAPAHRTIFPAVMASTLLGFEYMFSSTYVSLVSGQITRTNYADLTCSEVVSISPYTSAAACTHHGTASYQTIACGTSAFAFGSGDYVVNV
jgi:hypothetical protein